MLQMGHAPSHLENLGDFGEYFQIIFFLIDVVFNIAKLNIIIITCQATKGLGENYEIIYFYSINKDKIEGVIKFRGEFIYMLS